MNHRAILLCLLVGTIALPVFSASDTPRQAGSGQQREEEVTRFLGNVEGHCHKMLDIQIAVNKETRRLSKAADSKQAAIRLSSRVKEATGDATKVIDLIEADGSAVAFAEVFRELREDLKRVQKRLEAGDVGKATQAIQQDIVETLREMIEALTRG
jgi:hypothetical protein